ncbi:MAG TPA: hypothetical protein VLS49_09035 [Usitatibacter sp.]|nr:hypothetical protein [Usitatibacter sp.]
MTERQRSPRDEFDALVRKARLERTVYLSERIAEALSALRNGVGRVRTSLRERIAALGRDAIGQGKGAPAAA